MIGAYSDKSACDCALTLLFEEAEPADQETPACLRVTSFCLFGQQTDTITGQTNHILSQTWEGKGSASGPREAEAGEAGQPRLAASLKPTAPSSNGKGEGVQGQLSNLDCLLLLTLAIARQVGCKDAANFGWPAPVPSASAGPEVQQAVQVEYS